MNTDNERVTQLILQVHLLCVTGDSDLDGEEAGEAALAAAVELRDALDDVQAVARADARLLVEGIEAVFEGFWLGRTIGHRCTAP